MLFNELLLQMFEDIDMDVDVDVDVDVDKDVDGYVDVDAYMVLDSLIDFIVYWPGSQVRKLLKFPETLKL